MMNGTGFGWLAESGLDAACIDPLQSLSTPNTTILKLDKDEQHYHHNDDYFLHDDGNGTRSRLSLVSSGLDGCLPAQHAHTRSRPLPRPSHLHRRSLTLDTITTTPMATGLHSYAVREVMTSSSLHHNHHIDQTSPGSPPELTNSKSSKSSSFHSSSLSDAISHDLAHFEDVTLDDDFGDGYMRKMADSHVKPRPNSSARLIASSNGARDLTTATAAARRPGAVSARTMSDLHAQPPPQMSLGLPPKRPSRRRGPKHAQPNTLVTNFGGYQSKRSRSVSPQSPLSMGASPRTGRLSAGPGPRPGMGLDGALQARRQSWQPGRRKTVQELEDEYHDSDEDLPEDAVIWNVPISPRPPQEREKSRSPRQSWSSAGGPRSPADVNKGLGLDFSASGNPISVVKPPQPKSPRLSSLPRSVSMTSIPEDYSLNPRSGTKSWDATLSDLSTEARMLTQVLEERAEEREKETERQVQNGTSSSPSKRTPKRTVSASTIELPPMRRGELMIDPLPVSKEKEKFLTRTRPSWLPPKDPEEEKRHLREYQKMMAKSIEAEKKREARLQKDQCKRDDTRESLAKVWQDTVLPDWDARIKDPQTRELWWKGITPRDRGVVWQRAVGNELGLTEASYTLARDRARAAETRLKSLSEQDAEKEPEARWFRDIRRDVREAFPELKIFQPPEGPLHEALVEVLMAYAVYRADVGYVYGTHFPAALLTLNLPPSEAFITLANLLNRPLPAALLTNNSPALETTFSSILSLLESSLPTLHTHLTNPRLNLAPETILRPLLTGLCATQSFGMDFASRIWDAYVFEGDAVLQRVCVAALGRLEPGLYGGSEAEILGVVREKRICELGSEDEFLEKVRGMGEEGGKREERRPNSW